MIDQPIIRHSGSLRTIVGALLALLVAACSQPTSSATAPASPSPVGTPDEAAIPDLVAVLDAIEVGEEQLAGFVVRADAIPDLAENFRVWRDAPIDYDACATTDPILLSPADEARGSDLGHVVHLVGRDQLTIVHAITAAERYQTAEAASTGFRATVAGMREGCIVLDAKETDLLGVGDEAALFTATRTCTYGDPSSFGAIVARYGNLITTTVVQRGDREHASQAVARLADDHAAAIRATADGSTAPARIGTSTFGLCIPDPDDPIALAFNENWKPRNTDLIRTFTQPGSTAHRDHPAIHQAVLDTLEQANAILGTSYGGPIDVYFYESIEQLQEAAPRTANEVLGFASGQEVHQLCGGTLDGTQWVNMAMSAHEYTHIVTLNLWGRTASPILVEGLAHYATVGERDSIAATYRFEILGPLATTADDDDRRGRTWGTLLTSYLIEERGGIEQFKDLWFAARTADLATSIEAVYGLTLEELDAAVRMQYDLRPLP